MIRHIAVLGAGTMGLSVAKLFAAHRYDVSLYEPSIHVREALEQQLQLSEETAAICLFSNLEKAVSEADLIIECVPEEIEIKRQLYLQLTSVLKQDAIIASNTSTFALQQLAQGLPYTDRMVITHFFNPAHLIPLVELIDLPNTRSGLIEKLVELFRHMGKTPVVLNKDIPGFIANRLQAALMREACYLLENGIASAEQIDSAVKDGVGLRWALKGPFEIADLGGLDIWSKVTGHLFPELENGTDIPASILDKLERSELGIKTGSGYYTYAHQTNAASEMNESLRNLLDLKNSQKES